MAATYAAEILPVALRSFVLSNVNMCWLIGQLIGALAVRRSLHVDSQWAWRLLVALQWAWAVPLLIIYCFAPESPCKCTEAAIVGVTISTNKSKGG